MAEEKEMKEEKRKEEEMQDKDSERGVAEKEQEKKPENEGEAGEEKEQSRDELAELKDKYLRLFAEFDNYKKRTVKQNVSLRMTASREIMEALLPVLDDFDRAKNSAESDDSTEEFSEGVSLVYQKLNSILKAKGLRRMETEGKKFDPDLHEALSEIPAEDEGQKGYILDTIETGYYLNDKIIRHAKVVVGK